MNIFEYKVLKYLEQNRGINQRNVAEGCGISLGTVNNAIHSLKEAGLVDESLSLTSGGLSLLAEAKPRNAIILAAGYGLRMVPINMNKSKAFLTVNGTPLIERLIDQLNEVGVTDISIVVGFMKESFDYLIDKYGVKLVYNRDYSCKNNLHSLNCAAKNISNTYIVPCDLWCRENPFSRSELYSWYMVKDTLDENSTVRVTRQLEFDGVKNHVPGNAMVGISYISEQDAPSLRQNLLTLCSDPQFDSLFWESALFYKKSIDVKANVVAEADVNEINSYEQLRDLDGHSEELQNDSISVICEVLNCENKDIGNIHTLKKGMTNRSYIFTVKDKKYIMRIPGEGTDMLINRKQEADVYNAIKGRNICDELFYINPDNGMKISAFVEGSRCCNAFDDSDLEKCMKKLRSFHELKLKVDHEFDIFGKIDFYQSLWQENNSIFSDYAETKRNVLSLKSFIEKCKPVMSLTHIDAICDNFLFSGEGENEEIQLIDWEYSGMQDPHVDIAMFAIYSFYDRDQTDRLIDIYFEGNCSETDRTKIYCYVAACGLLWSNWCEYKRQFGIEFGEYSLKQYRYAKDFYKFAMENISNMEGKDE